ncbi:hypothetical protein BK735_27710 [Bacillus mycoides]|uniref:Viral late gene transcription factor 3 zinc ribbon domain-containing protein n=1 Tax=Bacillus mycoides TaxID=1405 RepID=A0A654BYI3_BACMY|nr:MULTISPECIES: hypothetical protein [Bacillus cereus group]MBJ8018446.1 hypothetical protein [Bacillus cereus group sp. N34]OTY13488.1 hypothetical protein BK735_27710 [Bacillus mycoides]QWI63561.1 hypothetical protein EXW57_27920 [Bacillus mycoides]VXC85904.1 conserved hypothetical protein [Bacillus mycoides]
MYNCNQCGTEMIMQLQDRYREFCPRCEGLRPSSLVYYNLYELLDYMEANNYMNKENMLHNFLKWEFELTKGNIFKLYLDVDRYDTPDDEDLIKQLEVYMKGIRLKLNVKYEDDYIWIKVN